MKTAHRLSTPWRARESWNPLELLIVLGSVYGGRGTIESGGKPHFPGAKTGRGGSGEGASSPVHQLVKSLFDKSRASLDSGGAVFEGIAIPAILRYNSIIRSRLEILSKGENVV